MTSVIARKFGERILVLADTQISDKNACADNIIPGRLKIITLSMYFTVAYEGHADPALCAVRAAKRALDEKGADAAIECLRESSGRTDVDVSFLLVTHHPAALRRVIRGAISDPGEGFAIGDTAMLPLVNEQSERVARAWAMSPPENLDPEFGSEDEWHFRSAFSTVLSQGRASKLKGVGGLPIDVIASPHGHTYGGGGSSFAWDEVLLSVGVTEEMQAARASGATMFTFNVMPSSLRGVGVLGAVLPQAGVGWLYDPIRHDEAVPYQLGTTSPDGAHQARMLEKMRTIVDEAAVSFGGGVRVAN